MATQDAIGQRDIDILRRLAERLAQLAEHPENVERRRSWYVHHDGGSGRPMVLAEMQGVMNEMPVDAALECEHPRARVLERGLRVELYQFEVLRDDHVLEPYVNLRWDVQTSTFGVEPVVHYADTGDRLGARSWDPPLTNLTTDFEKLRHRSFTVDRDATGARKAELESIFEGILQVRLRGPYWWTFGMTWTAIDLIGLENLMLFMYDEPEGLHRLMQFIHDDFLAFANWLEAEGLLTLNNENDYVGSGTLGYTRRLPRIDWTPDAPVRKADQWVLLESQETVGVGPEQFEEFIFPYQQDLAERFGLLYYGCCEPVNNRWHILERIRNLHSVSVSPWADEEFMASALGRDYVYSRKPSPTLISTSSFDEDLIRKDLRHTLDVARDCRVEIIMKDVHTLNGRPERLARWVEIARSEIAEKWMGA